jgi:hypothetical protein
MRPATTLLKSAIGELLHASDVVRNPARKLPVPAFPERPTFTITTIGHWFTPDRTQWLVPTIEMLRRQRGEMSIALITNDPDAAIEGLGPIGADIARFDSASAAAAHLLAHPGVTVALRWTKTRRRTHPKEMSFGHKPLMRSLMWEHACFAHGASHLLHIEDDLALADGALDYWVQARPVLDPYGLLPGFSRWEGRGDDRRIADQQRTTYLARIPVLEAPLRADSDRTVLWANLPNPHQAFFILDERLARRNLSTSRYLSPARSVSGPKSWARDLGVIERSAVGPICDDVPAGYRTRNVVPLLDDERGPRLLPECLVEHQPAPAYFREGARFARVPLEEAFVDDRAAPEPVTPANAWG